MYSNHLPFLPERNGSASKAPPEPDLYEALNALIDPLEMLDCFIESVDNKLRSNAEARKGSLLDEFHCEAERETLLDELEVASTAALHLRAIISLANRLL